MKNNFLLILVIPVILILSGCEREGIANIDDCMETIKIKDGDMQTYYKTFTCTYQKTDKGNVMNGVCTDIKTSFLGSKCKTAYIYEKEPYKKCLDDEYLAQNGDCKCLIGIKRNNNCVSYDEVCRLSYGDNVHGAEILLDENNASCDCIFGYVWNKEKTKCVSVDEANEACRLSYGDNNIQSDYNSNCDCMSEYVWNKEKTKCISINEVCRLSYGDNVVGVESLSGNKCHCLFGYVWNKGKTRCISINE